MDPESLVVQHAEWRWCMWSKNGLISCVHCILPVSQQGKMQDTADGLPGGLGSQHPTFSNKQFKPRAVGCNATVLSRSRPERKRRHRCRGCTPAGGCYNLNVYDPVYIVCRCKLPVWHLHVTASPTHPCITAV